jgi:membrane protease YdiL (CAAX protease family)
MARFDRVSLSALGFVRHEGWIRDIGAGVLVAGAMLMLWLAGAYLFGNVVMEWNSVADLPAVGFTLAVLMVSALNEELVFRGYPLQVLMKGIGPWPATLLISCLFGLLHARNEGVTALGVANTVLAGVFLSRAYMVTRSLWLPYGFHAGWNIGTAVLLGLPVSGIPTASFFTTEATGPDPWIGGPYGPEGGILVTLIFLAGTLVIGRLRIGRVSPEVHAALATHSDKVYIEAAS